MLFCFDEGVVRVLDTVKPINQTNPIRASASAPIANFVEDTVINGMPCVHYTIDYTADLMGAALTERTDFWVSKSLPIQYKGLVAFYNPFLNGTGYAIIKYRRTSEIAGLETTITEATLERVEAKPLLDSDLILVAATR